MTCYYEIRIEEHLADWLLEYFPMMKIARCEGDVEGSTSLTGLLPDQSALFGVLARIRDLNLTLVSVIRLARPD